MVSAMTKASSSVPLHHVIEGNGPWITLAHSLASDLTLLDGQARMLARRFRVLRFDIRGHGNSPAPAAPYAMDDLAADVQALFDELGVTETAWVGVSLGGMIGLTHALRRPGVITRLAVADTTAGYPAAAHAGWRDRISMARQHGTAATVDGTLARWFTPAFLQREPDAVRRCARLIAATPVEGFVGCCEAILGYNIERELPGIACPTLVMVGEQDQATPPTMAQTLANAIPGASLAVIPAAAHISSLEQPALFNARLEEFLAPVSVGPA